jgi:glutathione S-transferase
MMPVTHLISLRRYAPGPTVPVLLDNIKAVQDSRQIIDYLDYKYHSPALTPENAADRQLCLEIEQTMLVMHFLELIYR